MVVDKELFSPGKGTAVVRLKLRKLKDGSLLRKVVKTDTSVEEISVNHQPVEFLYQSGQKFVFMNPQTFEQFEVEANLIGEKRNFIKEEVEYQLVTLEDQVIELKLPKKMTFEVKETVEAVKDNTATGATKPAKLETGLVVNVPLFVKKKDRIIVNTETGEYQ